MFAAAVDLESEPGRVVVTRETDTGKPLYLNRLNRHFALIIMHLQCFDTFRQ